MKTFMEQSRNGFRLIAWTVRGWIAYSLCLISLLQWLTPRKLPPTKTPAPLGPLLLFLRLAGGFSSDNGPVWRVLLWAGPGTWPASLLVWWASLPVCPGGRLQPPHPAGTDRVERCLSSDRPGQETSLLSNKPFKKEWISDLLGEEVNSQRILCGVCPQLDLSQDLRGDRRQHEETKRQIQVGASSSWFLQPSRRSLLIIPGWWRSCSWRMRGVPWHSRGLPACPLPEQWRDGRSLDDSDRPEEEDPQLSGRGVDVKV